MHPGSSADQFSFDLFSEICGDVSLYYHFSKDQILLSIVIVSWQNMIVAYQTVPNDFFFLPFLFSNFAYLPYLPFFHLGPRVPVFCSYAT